MGPQISFQTTRLAILPGTALFRKGLQEGWFTRKSYFEAESLTYYEQQGQPCVQGFSTAQPFVKDHQSFLLDIGS